MQFSGAALKAKTISSILWSVARTGWGTIVSFLVFALLARMLGPADFGTFALASLLFELARIIGNGGFPDAVVREPELDEVMADSVFWASVAMNVTVAAAIFALAPWYETMTSTAGVADLVRWLCPALPLAALGNVHSARVARAFQHKRLAVQGFIVSSVAGAAAVAGAYYGMGAYSLVVQVFLTSVIGSISAWYIFPWVPRFRFDVRKFRSCLQFGVSMMTTQLIWTLTARLQEPFIGRSFGPEAVGQYRVAWRLIELIGQMVLAPIGSVALVTLSNLQNDKILFASAFKRMVIGAALITLPLMFGFGALSVELIGLAFGAQWKVAAPIAEVLVLMAVPFFLNYVSGPALSAIGKPHYVLAVSALQLALTVILTYLATPYGMLAVAGAYVLRAYITAPVQLAALRLAIGHINMKIWPELLPIAALSFVIFGATWIINPHTVKFIASDAIRLLALGSLSLLLYAAALILFQHKQIGPYIAPAIKALNALRGKTAA